MPNESVTNAKVQIRSAITGNETSLTVGTLAQAVTKKGIDGFLSRAWLSLTTGCNFFGDTAKKTLAMALNNTIVMAGLTPPRAETKEGRQILEAYVTDLNNATTPAKVSRVAGSVVTPSSNDQVLRNLYAADIKEAIKESLRTPLNKNIDLSTPVFQYLSHSIDNDTDLKAVVALLAEDKFIRDSGDKAIELLISALPQGKDTSARKAMLRNEFSKQSIRADAVSNLTKLSKSADIQSKEIQSSVEAYIAVAPHEELIQALFDKKAIRHYNGAFHEALAKAIETATGKEGQTPVRASEVSQLITKEMEARSVKRSEMTALIEACAQEKNFNKLMYYVNTYFKNGTGDDEKDLKDLFQALIVKGVMTADSKDFNIALAEAVDEYQIANNQALNDRISEIEHKGMLETTPVKSLTTPAAYAKDNKTKNIEAPVEYTSKVVLDVQSPLDVETLPPGKWADTQDADGNPDKRIGDPAHDLRVRLNKKGFPAEPTAVRIKDRVTGVLNSFGIRTVVVEKATGRPINQACKTGMTGRGLLGKFGPNPAADPLVSNVDLKDGLVKIVAVQRRDNGKWAIPGGIVDPGEKASQTAWREFAEEAGNIPVGNISNFIEKLSAWNNGKLKGQLKDISKEIDNAGFKLQIFEGRQKAFNEFKADLKAKEGDNYNLIRYLDFEDYCKLMLDPNFINELVKDKEKAIKPADAEKVRQLFEREGIKANASQKEAIKVIEPIIEKLKDVYREGFVKEVLGVKNAKEVFVGYSDDERNTDNAWLETSAYNWEIQEGSPEAEIINLCSAGDDAVGKRKLDPIKEELFASHNGIAAKMVVGKRSETMKQLGPQQLANFLAQRIQARELLLTWPNRP